MFFLNIFIFFLTSMNICLFVLDKCSIRVYYCLIFSVQALNKQIIKPEPTLPFNERNKPAYGYKVGPKKRRNYRRKQEFFGCKYCSCDYKRKQQLLAHILRRHIQNNNWFFVANCSFCLSFVIKIIHKKFLFIIKKC